MMTTIFQRTHFHQDWTSGHSLYPVSLLSAFTVHSGLNTIRISRALFNWCTLLFNGCFS